MLLPLVPVISRSPPHSMENLLVLPKLLQKNCMHLDNWVLKVLKDHGELYVL